MPREALAYGLRIDSTGLNVPGLATGRPPNDTGRRCAVALADGPEPAWPGDATQLLELRFAGGGAATTIHVHHEAGLRLWSAGYGVFRLGAGGRRITCHPAQPPALPWERCLLAQALPLAALMQGLEPLHAAAVAIDGVAVAVAGPSHAGKSSIVAHLVASGARFMCDDVLAVEARDGELHGHPGPALLAVRHAEHRRLDAGELRALGPMLARDREKLFHWPARADGELPLRALYVLDRSSGHEALDVEPLRDAAPLLATTFNTVVRTPARLRRQLEVAGLLAHGVAQRVRVPAHADARAVAAALLARGRAGAAA